MTVAVPPLSFPPLTTPLDLPHFGQVRSPPFMWALTINTFPQAGQASAMLLPYQSSRSPSLFLSRSRCMGRE